MPRHILYAVLNWGLGHATRSITVINALLAKGFKITIASDGLALNFLKNQFAELLFLELAELDVTYGTGKNQTLALLSKSTQYALWFQQDRKLILEHVNQTKYCGIISDNRPTVFHDHIPSIYLTHQLHIEAGMLSFFASGLHGKLYRGFNEVWIPDIETSPGLSGKLGHTAINKKTKFIGPLSDLTVTQGNSAIDIVVILSGPEPQRTLLENDIINQLKNQSLSVRLLRGTHKQPEVELPNGWRVLNLASRGDVQKAFDDAKVIIARSGYSTLMDLANCPKPAILIPTPGQPEQEYLASLASHQNSYAIQKQDQLDLTRGLAQAKEKFKNQKQIHFQPDWDDLFSVFEGKRKG